MQENTLSTVRTATPALERDLFPASPVLDEAALAALDAAAKSPSFDADLLRLQPVRDIRICVQALLLLLGKIDHRRLTAKQGFLFRLTGADVEARLEFELSSQKVLLAVRQLRQAARNGRRVRVLLGDARTMLCAEQDRLEGVVEAAEALLVRCEDAEPFLRARFERRLANILAMHTANILAIEQLRQANDVLSGALDRFTDVDTLLLPLWQRNVVALAQASGRGEQRTAVSEFAQAHHSLITRLEQEPSP